MKLVGKIILVVLLEMAILGCGTSGHYVTEKRATEPFDSIEISGAAELDIEVGPQVSVTVEGDDHVLGRLQTDVRDGKLWIHSEVPYVPDANIVITITMPSLSYLGVSAAGTIDTSVSGAPLDKLEVRVAGVGKLNLKGIDAEELDVRARGAANVSISGRTTVLKYDMSGAGAGKLGELCVGEAEVTVNGAGKAVVNASNKLDATLHGIGSIHYYGSPEITEHVSKTGGLKHLDYNDEITACGPPVGNLSP